VSFHHSYCCEPLIILKLRLFCRSARKNGYYVVYEKKSVSDSRSVENILDKRLRIEVQPTQTNVVERVNRFVNVHLHGIIRNLKRISKIWTLPHPGKISATSMWCTDFDLILGSQSAVLFGSILLSHSKTINAKFTSFPDLYTKRSNQKALQF